MAENDQSGAAPEAANERAGDATGSAPDVVALLAAAQDAAGKARDQMLRAQAEAENVRRRAQRDVENAHKYALERFAADLLPVIDSLERAAEIARGAAESPSVKAIAEGVALSLKLFVDTLGKAGIQRVDPVGAPFDPKVHQAVTMVESPDAEPGSVVKVLQPGFTLHGRVVRPAMVMVARAPQAGTGKASAPEGSKASDA